MTIDRETLAWLAGFMDGEGSFYVSAVQTHRNRIDGGYLSMRPRVSVCNAHVPTTDYAAALFSEFGTVQRPIKDPGGTRRPVHHAALVSWESCRDICAALLPHLRTKKEHAQILHDWADDRLRRMAQFGRFRVGWDESDLDAMARLKELNKRGTAQ